MPRLMLLLGILLFASDLFAAESAKGVLAIHGGYAYADKPLPPELFKGFCEGLKRSLAEGYAVWKEGKPGLDVVEASVRVLEDVSLFNAGKGAVFNNEGVNELDASIMEGKTKMAGAVAGVRTVRNPISAARAVMEKTQHVLLIGGGADKFAKEQGLEIVKPAYFKTEHRWKQFLTGKKADKKNGASHFVLPPRQWGTVGAVVRDKAGNLAAGTSTGGLSNKKNGRVGDSPLIGAGTYADNAGVAVSGTGHGEYFIRHNVASEINSLVKYKGMPLKDAVHHVLFNILNKDRGEGGVIAIDKDGAIALDANSEGVNRGYVTEGGEVFAYVYEERCP